jgi:co-chaperonin GroES (HSP10)
MTHTIRGNIKPLRGRVLVKKLEFGQQKTTGGIILMDDDMKDHGIRPRWAQMYRVGDEIDFVQEGQWVLMAHGRWSPGVVVDNGEEVFDMRLADNKDILGVQDDRPEGITTRYD